MAQSKVRGRGDGRWRNSAAGGRYRTAIATAASAAGRDQAQSPANEAAAAATTHPKRNPSKQPSKWFNWGWIVRQQGMAVRQQVHRWQDRVGQIAGHHRRRDRARHSKAEEGVLAGHEFHAARLLKAASRRLAAGAHVPELKKIRSLRIAGASHFADTGIKDLTLHSSNSNYSVILLPDEQRTEDAFGW
jgi:hypothetical protein